MPLPRYFGLLADVTAVHLKCLQVDRLHCHPRGHCFLHITWQQAFGIARQLLAPSHALIHCLIYLPISQSAGLVHRDVLEDEIGTASLLLERDDVRIQSLFVVFEVAVILSSIFFVTCQYIFSRTHLVEMDCRCSLREGGEGVHFESILMWVL